MAAESTTIELLAAALTLTKAVAEGAAAGGAETFTDAVATMARSMASCSSALLPPTGEAACTGVGAPTAALTAVVGMATAAAEAETVAEVERVSTAVAAEAEAEATAEPVATAGPAAV